MTALMEVVQGRVWLCLGRGAGERVQGRGADSWLKRRQGIGEGQRAFRGEGGLMGMTVAREQTPMLLPPRTLNLGHPHHFTDREAKAQRGRVTCLKAHSS